MKILDFTQYTSWVAERKTGKVPGTAHTATRGAYCEFEPVCIHSYDRINPDDLSPTARAEFDLVWNGAINVKSIIDKLYEYDEQLLAAYKKLNVHNLSGKDKSRNNVTVVAECCLAYWSFVNGRLTVISRSMDIQRAGITDALVVAACAHKLGAAEWMLVNLHPHVYQRRDVVARRPH